MKNWILLTGPGLFNFDDIHQPPEGFFTQVQTFPTLVVSIRTQPAARFVPIQNIQWRLTPRWSTSIVVHDKLAKNHISIVHTRDAGKHLPLGKHFSAIDFDTTQFTYEGRTHQEVNLGNKWTGRWRWSTNYFLLVWSSKLSIKEPQENRKQKISTTFEVSFYISLENKVHLYAWIHLQDFWPIWDEISSYTFSLPSCYALHFLHDAPLIDRLVFSDRDWCISIAAFYPSCFFSDSLRTDLL